MATRFAAAVEVVALCSQRTFHKVMLGGEPGVEVCVRAERSATVWLPQSIPQVQPFGRTEPRKVSHNVAGERNRRGAPTSRRRSQRQRWAATQDGSRAPGSPLSRWGSSQGLPEGDHGWR